MKAYYPDNSKSQTIVCFIAATNLAPVTTKPTIILTCQGLGNVFIRSTKLYVMVHTRCTNFWNQFNIFITALLRKPKTKRTVITSGIFFSSTKAIVTSAWHMMNSTAPAPKPCTRSSQDSLKSQHYICHQTAQLLQGMHNT